MTTRKPQHFKLRLAARFKLGKCTAYEVLDTVLVESRFFTRRALVDGVPLEKPMKMRSRTGKGAITTSGLCRGHGVEDGPEGRSGSSKYRIRPIVTDVPTRTGKSVVVVRTVISLAPPTRNVNPSEPRSFFSDDSSNMRPRW